ncbi:MAG: CRISPR system precrRNA processing endoribonuclease RAMP protein Cas6 [Acidobacteria bacterium]|nr:CRISPR system precrRNA processing endoribonuclease RAMP protein Cas6 [Acidobacteriota bacterium]
MRGFIGTCEYSVGPRAPEDVSRALHLLADFAFFCGVGLKTTMGMGQVLGEPI